nr:long chain acyl-CoA synthetase 6, peroxisomal-like [Ipomoea trifida]
METKANRRLQAIHHHLTTTADDSPSLLRSSLTAGEYYSEQGYSVVLPEKLQTGKWNVYRSARSPLKLVSRFVDHPEIGTLHENFVRTVKDFSHRNYLGTRVGEDGTVGEYRWMTYEEAGPEAAKYITNHAAIKAIFCMPQTLYNLLSFLSEIPSVQLIVVVGGVDGKIPSLPASTGVEVISYSKLLAQGLDNLQPFSSPNPNDVATICYTSGTTGTPKGVVLTHANLVANVAGLSLCLSMHFTDIYISYLPLAHIFERANQVLVVYFGGATGFYQGDNLKLPDDMLVLRPTVFCSVPRLYNRLYSGIMNAVKTSGVLRERMFNTAYNAKKHAIFAGKSPSQMWDRLVFNKIKARCFGCKVVEGYGMTETSCAISTMDMNDILSGHVGAPNPACEIKLVDVPEMNYTSEDQPHPRGEICIRGPIIFQGYYKDEVQTREVIDEDGWFRTGDIGLWLPGGRLKIIDRKKNIFKLAQGEYVAPEKIENVYAKSKFIAQCFVYGDSLNSSLVAIVSVDPEILTAWAATEGIKYNDLEELCSNAKARSAVLADMDAIGKEAQLRGFEYAKAVTLVPEPFTLENGLLTPTLKIKRQQAKAYFAKAIEEMYGDLADSGAASQKMLKL